MTTVKNKQKHINPFILKTPVKGNFFLGRDYLLDRIYHCLSTGISVSLVGERRIGKTSLLHRMLDVKEQYLKNSDQYVFVFQDFSSLEFNSQLDIWGVLLSNLLEEIPVKKPVTISLKQLLSEEPLFPVLLNLFREFSTNGLAICFLFDEFEYTVRGKKPVDISFYKILRNLTLDQKTRLTYVIATRQELSTVEGHLEKRFKKSNHCAFRSAYISI